MLFIKTIRKSLHLSKIKYRDNSNRLIIHMPNGRIIRNPRYVKHFNVRFKGKNSTIEIYLPCNLNSSLFVLYNNDHFIINKNVSADIFAIGSACVPGYGGAKLIIGENCSLNNTKFYLNSCPNAFIELGNDCMFSMDITLWASDTHQIIDCGTGKIINKRYGIKIGNHVWCGTRCTILKDTIIQDNSIIGANSVVSGKFDVGNIIIAGHPAKQIKSGIDWKRESLPQ